VIGRSVRGQNALGSLLVLGVDVVERRPADEVLRDVPEHASDRRTPVLEAPLLVTDRDDVRRVSNQPFQVRMWYRIIRISFTVYR